MIRETLVDGVPTVVAPTSGPMHAGLVFRVGTADETLARSGITHLLEHLALHKFGLADYHYNGATGSYLTFFHTHGSPADITAFLSGVCDALGALPVDRLETEKTILQTEWRTRSASVMEQFPLWRHGARDYGLASYAEVGLNALTAEDVREWSARYFTRDNAVLWIAGDGVPADLRLRLPDGRRQPLPAASSALPTTPAYFPGVPAAVAWDAIVPRGTAAGVFAGVLERELFRVLRQEDGLSYTATAVYEPRGNESARVAALADALPEKHDAVLGGFIDVLAGLRVGRIEQSDVDAVVAKRRDGVAHADADADRLQGYAVNLLTGYRNPSIEEYVAELAAVTAADVHAVAVTASRSALLMVPSEHRADWAGFTPAPTHSEHVVAGTRYPSREVDDVHLVVGPSGASLDFAGSAPVTVRFAEAAALIAWPDGARELIGDDGIRVRIEPTLFDVHPAAMHLIDAAVPAARRVLMPARDPEAIPQPEPRTPEPPPPYPAQPQYPAQPPYAPYPVPAPRKNSVFEVITLAVVGLAAMFFVSCGGLMTLGVSIDESAGADMWVFVGVLWVLAVILLLPTVLLFRRLTRRT